jgi:beta-phosphoglucomutase-like phosphatase (HAD superfamily)
MRALVFDYDGLIVDSETPEYECWKKVFADHGERLAIEDWVHVVGGAHHFDMKAELERRLGRPVQGWDRVDAARVEHYRGIFEGQGLLPGVQALFDEGRRLGWRIGVASNSTSDWVGRGLKRFRLDGHVQALRARDTAARPKPDPAPYLEVLAELGARAEPSFGFEDSAPGVAAARAAGLTVVAVPNALTRHHDLRAAHHLLESLEHFILPE